MLFPSCPVGETEERGSKSVFPSGAIEYCYLIEVRQNDSEQQYPFLLQLSNMLETDQTPVNKMKDTRKHNFLWTPEIKHIKSGIYIKM